MMERFEMADGVSYYIDPRILRKARAAAERLFRKLGVVSVEVGSKVVKGKKTKTLAIVVGVRKKLPKVLLKRRDLIPDIIKGMFTDVIEVGEIRALTNPSETDPADHQRRRRPLVGGISIGHKAVSAGTLGFITYDEDGNNILVSNCHVLANSGDCSIGDSVLQPGSYDGGVMPDDVVAYLSRFVPIRFLSGEGEGMLRRLWSSILSIFGLGQNPPVNKVDAAIASPLDGITDPGRPILGIPEYREEAFPMTLPKLGMKVVKSGRTTGVVRGEITGVDASVIVNYGKGKRAKFVGQFTTTPAIGEPGDSGSAILFSEGDAGSVAVDENGDIIGLLFAGSEHMTIANPIIDVYEELGL